MKFRTAFVVILHTLLSLNLLSKPVFKQCPINIEVEYQQDFDYDLLQLLSDEGIPPRFWEMRKHPEFPNHEVPPWLSINSSEHWVGKPNDPSHLKSYQFLLSVVDNEKADQCPTTNIHVKSHPRWTHLPNVLDLGVAREEQDFEFDLKPFVFDAASGIPGYQLLFSKNAQVPQWLKLDPATGKLSGNPKRTDVGNFQGFEFTVSNKDGSSVTQAKIVVLKTIHPPRWTQNPILLPNALETASYLQILRGYIENREGMTLHCGKEEAFAWPNWLQINDQCEVSGTPQIQDVGTVSVKVRFDSEPFEGLIYSDVTTLQFKVDPFNDPPEFKPMAFSVKERETLSVDLVNPASPFITDQEGDPISCQLLTPSAWVTVTPKCQLVAKPTHAELGMNPQKSYSFAIRATDGEKASQGVLEITVLRNPRPPVWNEDPIRITAGTNAPLVGVSLSGRATDLDGWPLTFKGGGSWLSVASDGTLSGTPTDIHLGENTFQVEACNDAFCTAAVLLVTVKSAIQKKTVTIGAPIPGAKTENIWMVDTSCASGFLVKTMAARMEAYYNRLKGNTSAPPIQHTGVFLSSDWRNYQGTPIESSSLLMRWTDFNNAEDWRTRKDIAWTTNCSNTPIWTLFNFYNKYPVIDDFFLEYVPAEVLVVSDRSDVYRLYATKNPFTANWYVPQFAYDFKKTNHYKRKPLSISVISAECSHREGERMGTFGRLAYETGGQCYVWKQSTMLGILDNYAKWVQYRAFVYGKHEIVLDDPPLASNPEIKVTLAGQPLFGNTGSSNDLWRFVAPDKIIVNWHLIDIRAYQGSDQLVIEYRISERRKNIG